MTNEIGTPTRGFIGLLMTLAVSVAWPGENRRAVWAQEDEQTIFVRLLDSATEAPVTDLRAEEFAIWQGGVECEVVSAELVETRLQLALVLDESGWMRDYSRHLRNGVPQVLDAYPREVRWQ